MALHGGKRMEEIALRAQAAHRKPQRTQDAWYSVPQMTDVLFTEGLSVHHLREARLTGLVQPQSLPCAHTQKLNT